MTNTRTLLLALLLSIALVVFVVRAVSVRRQGVAWLEELDSRITPLALEEILGAPERETPSTVASELCEERGVPTIVESSAAKETQRGNEIAHAGGGGARAPGVLFEVMRRARPLPAYDAYLSLRELRGEAGEFLSLEEFERCRTLVVDEYAAWLENRGTADEAAVFLSTDCTDYTDLDGE
jgi:hypothetical protein